MWSEAEQFTPTWTKVMIAVWVVTLPLTILFGSLSGMAFEAGERLSTYVFVGAAFTYPVSILIAFVLRRKLPAMVFLPALNIGVWLISGKM